MVEQIPIAALLPVLLIAVGWVGWCWWDIAHHPVRGLPKWAWALVCLLSIPVGGIVYLLAGREDR